MGEHQEIRKGIENRRISSALSEFLKTRRNLIERREPKDVQTISRISRCNIK
jgi:hypothetical protein